jgi:type VI secretion system protein ImpJ
MKSPQRLVWSEGMLLSPQHLQALDRYQEALVAARIEAISPVDWGVLALEVDQAAMAAGQLRLTRFAGVLPDGLPVTFEDGDPGAPAPRAIAERFPPTARDVDVYLAVPREREGVPAFSESVQGSPSRFLSASRPVRDAAGAGGTVPVSFARPNVQFLLGDEPRDDFDTLRVARLVRNAAGQFALAESFLPPCLRLSAAPRLVAGVREVLARAVAKQRDLMETRRNRDFASGEVTGPDLVRLLQLLSVNEAIPVLAHLAAAPDVAPREAYLALAGLAGRLGTFAADADPTTLSKFNHAELAETFDPLFAVLGALLGGLAVAQFVSVPLEQRAGGLHLARMQEEKLLRGSQLFLVVKSDLPEAQVTESLPRLCKIASAAEIQGLVQAAAPGLPVQVVHRPPPQLPLRQGSQYFSLNTENRYWQGITNGRNMAIYLPPPFDPTRTKVELLAITAAQAKPAEPARRG